MLRRSSSSAAAVCIVIVPLLAAQEWRFYGGDQASTRYSSLDRINRTNVRTLHLAWEWKTGETAFKEFNTTPGIFEATPLISGGRLYLSTPYNRVVALDPQ